MGFPKSWTPSEELGGDHNWPIKDRLTLDSRRAALLALPQRSRYSSPNNGLLEDKYIIFLLVCWGRSSLELLPSFVWAGAGERSQASDACPHRLLTGFLIRSRNCFRSFWNPWPHIRAFLMSPKQLWIRHSYCSTVFIVRYGTPLGSDLKMSGVFLQQQVWTSISELAWLEFYEAKVHKLHPNYTCWEPWSFQVWRLRERWRWF